MLEVRHLGKCFNDKLIINDISFSINEGEIVSLLGNNGSGKTTTIKLMTNLLIKDKGEVLLNNKPLKIKDIGYLSEERSLYYDCSVNEQLKLLASLAKIEDSEQVIEYYLNRVGLLDKADKLICELSKGNQQKVAFISALLKGPTVLFLDEPFTGLDKENIKLFESMIMEYITSKRIVILSSHIYDPINKYSNRFIVIKEGQIALNITRQQLKEDQRRIIITNSDVELKNYVEKVEEKKKIKYFYDDEQKALRALKWMIHNGIEDYTYRHLTIEDLV